MYAKIYQIHKLLHNYNMIWYVLYWFKLVSIESLVVATMNSCRIDLIETTDFPDLSKANIIHQTSIVEICKPGGNVLINRVTSQLLKTYTDLFYTNAISNKEKNSNKTCLLF